MNRCCFRRRFRSWWTRITWRGSLNSVIEEIDLEAIERVYRVDRGQPPFDPAMMTALLLYGYCNGVYSSRRIARLVANASTS